MADIYNLKQAGLLKRSLEKEPQILQRNRAAMVAALLRSG